MHIRLGIIQGFRSFSHPPRELGSVFFLMKRRYCDSTSKHSLSSPPAKKHRPYTATMVSRTITLTEQEEQLKRLLVDVARYIDSSSSENSPTILRWAGGWVRDKLLGIKSHDIDTAINNLTGEAFVGKLRDYVEIPDNKQLHNLMDSDIGRLHTVARNPDKSKHLETSTIKLCGLDVDFVNLRKETYCENSRNPEVEFGTAEEDAARRDATVNALFYNLQTGEVEDHVGGLPDLGAGIIRTPMEPLQTFMDDPLRVLRLVRFASRLGFKIDKAAEEVMADENVLRNLKIKISRERIGVELEKMLKGKIQTTFYRSERHNNANIVFQANTRSSP